MLDLLELHDIELRKFTRSKPQELLTRFERWLYFLKFADLYNVDEPSLPATLAQEEGIPMAIDSMRKVSAFQPPRMRCCGEDRLPPVR